MSTNTSVEPLNLKLSIDRVKDALREMGDLPPVGHDESRAGQWPFPDSSFSLEAAVRWLQEKPKENDSMIIYGFVGNNRYLVYGDGRILAIGWRLGTYQQKTDPKLARLKVQELGFGISE